MRKRICLLSVFVILLSSCTQDSPSPASGSTINQNDVLVKEVYYGPRPGPPEQNWTHKFTYNGKKISKISIGPFYPFEKRYTYTGDLITSEELFRVSNTSSSLYERYVYEYDANGRLEIVRKQSGATGSTLYLYKKYTYNTDGTVVENSNPSVVTTFYFNNGNIVKTVQVTPTGNNTLNYTYDNANAPFRNITGFNKLMILWGINPDYSYGNQHNIKSIIYSSGEVYFKVAYTYDLLTNFPLKSVFTEYSSNDRQIIYY
ncbi:MAG: hypothetical protein ABI426_07315 [Flavobacterium sp.]